MRAGSLRAAWSRLWRWCREVTAGPSWSYGVWHVSDSEGNVEGVVGRRAAQRVRAAWEAQGRKGVQMW